MIIYYVPGTVPSTVNTAVNMTDMVPILMELNSGRRKNRESTRSKQTRKISDAYVNSDISQLLYNRGKAGPFFLSNSRTEI